MDPIIFPAGQRVDTALYRDTVLKELVPWMLERWGPGNFVLMQNGAPAHTSKATQAYLADQVGVDGFWAKDMWPPSSPDFSFWSVLASTVCDRVPKNKDDLVERIKAKWHDILKPDYVVRTCASAWDRLRRVVEAQGSYIEL